MTSPMTSEARPSFDPDDADAVEQAIDNLIDAGVVERAGSCRYRYTPDGDEDGVYVTERALAAIVAHSRRELNATS